jgi:hypothetical protein
VTLSGSGPSRVCGWVLKWLVYRFEKGSGWFFEEKWKKGDSIRPIEKNIASRVQN